MSMLRIVLIVLAHRRTYLDIHTMTLPQAEPDEKYTYLPQVSYF